MLFKLNICFKKHPMFWVTFCKLNETLCYTLTSSVISVVLTWMCIVLDYKMIYTKFSSHLLSAMTSMLNVNFSSVGEMKERDSCGRQDKVRRGDVTREVTNGEVDEVCRVCNRRRRVGEGGRGTQPGWLTAYDIEYRRCRMWLIRHNSGRRAGIVQSMLRCWHIQSHTVPHTAGQRACTWCQVVSRPKAANDNEYVNSLTADRKYKTGKWWRTSEKRRDHKYNISQY